MPGLHFIMKRAVLFLMMLSAVLATSCTKESFITGRDALLETSEDSLHFDTVFTTTGSITHYFKIYNRNDNKLLISNIYLSGNDNSYFRINADGIPGPDISDIEIVANDSLYVFVTVKIDPTSADLPFVVEDSIGISYNGNERWVQLRAWGQNANFLRSMVISSDTMWTNEKPFVILGGIAVLNGATLTIEKGTRIHLHADAPFLVDGTLTAVGEKYDSTKITFLGDRLDEYYRDHPGSWPGIYFRETSVNNMLRHVIVKNAYQGIVSEKLSSAGTPKVTLDQCIIDNCYDAGIIGVESSITAVNSLISNCGKNILLVKGGSYDFSHCTAVSYSNVYIPHKQPVLAVTNFVKLDDIISVSDLRADFINCIFWGDHGTVENEVVVAKEGNTTFAVDFRNCLWKVVNDPAGVTSSGMITNEDPDFETIETTKNQYNFRLKEGSPAINAGIMTTFTVDLDDRERLNIPDLGAYETTF